MLALALTGLSLAQETGPTAPPLRESGPQSAQWERMSVEEKLKYDAVHFVDIEHLFFAGIGAGLDQWRDKPSEWGQGWGAYGERFGSHVGQYAIQRAIMFPVQAIDHEDTRYWPSKNKSYKLRIRDAALQTVWRHSDDGGMMPAYSEIFGDYGAAAISRAWWPERYHNASSILTAGSNTILIDAGINLFHEFTPEIKHVLHIKR